MSSNRKPSYFHSKKYKNGKLVHVVTGAYRLNTRTGLLTCAGAIYDVRQELKDLEALKTKANLFHQLDFTIRFKNSQEQNLLQAERGPSYYEILGLTEEYTPEEAFAISKEKKYDDRGVLLPTLPTNYQVAYTILSDPVLRKIYDSKSSLMKKTYYEFLKIKEDATLNQIKEAYKIKYDEVMQDQTSQRPKLSMKKATYLTTQLNVALNILSNTLCRAAYDSQLGTYRLYQWQMKQLAGQWNRKSHMDLALRRFKESAHKIQFTQPLFIGQKTLRSLDSRVSYHIYRRLERFIRKVFCLPCGIQANNLNIMSNERFRSLLNTEQPKIFSDQRTPHEVVDDMMDERYSRGSYERSPRNISPDRPIARYQRNDNLLRSLLDLLGIEMDRQPQEEDHEDENEDKAEEENENEQHEQESECFDFCFYLRWFFISMLLAAYIAYLQNVLTEPMIIQALNYSYNKVLIPSYYKVATIIYLYLITPIYDNLLGVDRHAYLA